MNPEMEPAQVLFPTRWVVADSYCSWFLTNQVIIDLQTSVLRSPVRWREPGVMRPLNLRDVPLPFLLHPVTLHSCRKD